MSRLSVIPLCLSVCLTASALRAQDGPAADIPELKVLSHYVGTWDVLITSPDAGFTKGEATAKWILDGKFVQQTGSMTSPDGSRTFKMKTLMTYDKQAQKYRMWQFRSDGSTAQATGEWDEATRTMTSVERNDQFTTTTKAHMTQDGTEKWTIVAKDQNDKTVFQISGTNTRRKQ